MEKVVRNVRDLKMVDRLALEQVIGGALREDQQVIIDVVTSADLHPVGENGSTNDVCTMKQVPGWWNIYEGLPDEAIDRLDAAIRQRANLKRVFE